MTIKQIVPKEAWQILKENTSALLIDVRTKEEADFVGVADLSEIGKKSVLLPWRLYPSMTANSSFKERLLEVVADLFPEKENQEINLLFLCRSGGRSQEAATTVSSLGYNCCNIIGGFEGELDSLGHRGSKNGWKAQNLPWRQS